MDADMGTARTLAEFIGVSPRSVTELGRRGIAVRARPGRWRLRESVQRYCDDLRQRGGGVAVSASAAAERGRLAKEQAVGAFVEHYNHARYHESLHNLTPADVS